ncbi:MAG: hypothetical protein OER80_11870 [Gammaproteobacteria bacterium]|nr:hypothetical protein [Gammaproteobacteria bacterium]MDH3767446.1 hypothetical protein [Gammaproteobacteria bacterium]
MNKLLISTSLAALLALMIPVTYAGDTKFGSVAPRAEHFRYVSSGNHYRTHRHDNRRYDRYRANRHDNRRANRRYRSHRNYYSYRPSSDYVYRPYSYVSHRYGARYYDSRYGHYYRGGDGIRISPYGITIFLGFDD